MKITSETVWKSRTESTKLIESPDTWKQPKVTTFKSTHPRTHTHMHSRGWTLPGYQLIKGNRINVCQEISEVKKVHPKTDKPYEDENVTLKWLLSFHFYTYSVSCSLSLASVTFLPSQNKPLYSSFFSSLARLGDSSTDLPLPWWSLSRAVCGGDSSTHVST